MTHDPLLSSWFQNSPFKRKLQRYIGGRCQSWTLCGEKMIMENIDNSSDICYKCRDGGSLMCCEVGL